MTTSFAHPAAIVEGPIGPGTRVWAFAHVLPGAVVGSDCNIGEHCYVESGAVVGDRVTVKNGVALWSGVVVESDVFIGPSAVFTNDRRPRSPRLEAVRERYADESWLERTLVRHGVTIGAGAVILPGIELGEFSFVAAGSVVTRDVPPHTLVAGNPARAAGWVCICGDRLVLDDGEAGCASCGRRYSRRETRVELLPDNR